MARTKRVGILTAGGDSPGLNAAIRGFGKAAIGHHGMKLLGFRDGRLAFGAPAPVLTLTPSSSDRRHGRQPAVRMELFRAEF